MHIWVIKTNKQTNKHRKDVSTEEYHDDNWAYHFHI